MLTLNQTAKVAVSAVTEGAKTGASIVAGNMINQRVAAAIKPAVPLMFRAYLDTPIGISAAGAIGAALITHFMSNNKQAMLAAGVMFEAAGVNLVTSFDFETKLNEILSGINLETITAAQ